MTESLPYTSKKSYAASTDTLGVVQYETYDVEGRNLTIGSLSDNTFVIGDVSGMITASGRRGHPSLEFVSLDLLKKLQDFLVPYNLTITMIKSETEADPIPEQQVTPKAAEENQVTSEVQDGKSIETENTVAEEKVPTVDKPTELDAALDSPARRVLKSLQTIKERK